MSASAWRTYERDEYLLLDHGSGNRSRDGEGEIGENVITTFANTAQPLINYTTHDLVQAYDRDIACGCGRTWRYLDGAVLGRSDYMVTVRATNVYPASVENLVRRVEGVTQYFQLHLSRNVSGMDEMKILVEPERTLQKEHWGDLGNRIQKIVKDNIGLRMDVEVVEPQTIPRTDLKFKRIVDKRPQDVRRRLER